MVDVALAAASEVAQEATLTSGSTTVGVGTVSCTCAVVMPAEAAQPHVAYLTGAIPSEGDTLRVEDKNLCVCAVEDVILGPHPLFKVAFRN